MKHISNQIDKCFGCTACSNICPVNAIVMIPDEEGFIQPKLDESLCIDCGKCVDVCPIDNKSFDNSETPEIYGFISSDEIVSASSSGGAFTHLALEVLRQGGRVIGAAFDDNWLAEHIIISKESELDKLRFS